MRRLLWFFFLIINLVATSVFAAEEFSVNAPYTPKVLQTDHVAGSVWLGNLANYPHLYEFQLPSTTTVRVELRAVDHTDPQPLFAGILVRDTDSQGVQEIARLSQTEQWSQEQSTRTKMNYQVRRPFETILGPGEYRFEISTPDNAGRYELQWGTGEADLGYFASLSSIRQIQQFHGYGWWHMFRVTHVYVPLLLIIIIAGLISTWHYARRRQIL